MVSPSVSVADPDVCLVSMPYAHLARPSIALGILKSCLTRAGIGCHVEHANLKFAEFVGLEVYGLMLQFRTDCLLGEWTFAGAAFRDGRDNLDEVLGSSRRYQPGNAPSGMDETQFRTMFAQLRALAPDFIDAIARRVLERNPRIVGSTSTFEQHCAALALLRRVKELAPEVVTILGGANCEGSMGWTTLKNCPWVDCAVSGEADELIAPLCESLLNGDPEVPHGAMTRAHVAMGRAKAFPGGNIPRAVVGNMAASPAPDFDEYFAALKDSPLKDFITPALAVESSRGCWWGQKSHCTFCGLNGVGMNYRAKDADRVYDEWKELATRYPTRKLSVVDNIVDMRHVRTLLPRLAKEGAPFQLFYETKANLRRDQVRLFAEAGVTKIQPGIEALHDDLLRLMGKGNSTTINIQLLKFAREYGVSTTWLVLVGFPGEDDRWHAEVAAWLPLIAHLQAPAGVVHIRFDRFSVYFEEPEKFGLDLRPYPAYSAVYPFGDDDLQDLAYFFRDANRPKNGTVLPGVAALQAAVVEWRKCYAQRLRPVLSATDDGESLRFFDTRPCAPRRRVELQGFSRELYLACDSAPTLKDLVARFHNDSKGIEQGLQDLIRAKLLLESRGKYLGLACFGDLPRPVSAEEHPNGYVEKFDTRRFGSLGRAWSQLKEGIPARTESAREILVR